MRNEDWLISELNKLQNQDQLRTTTPRPAVGGKFHDPDGRTILNFSSNDYLNFASRPEIVNTSRRYVEEFGCGSGASRLMSGELYIHAELEQELASYKGYPAALTFGSGFLANTGIIPALVGRHDTVYADKLIHASILAGVQLSGARLLRFQHNNADHLEELMSQRNKDSGRALVITESVFSMDGNIAPLAEIATICEQNNAMFMVDEAHATGIFGKGGTGLINEFNIRDDVNIAMGTFSKALGNYGGFCACSTRMRSWLVNRARTFIYTTAPPPGVAGGCRQALATLQQEPGLGKELLNRADTFRKELQERGLDTGTSESQIIPVMVGESKTALRLSNRLHEQGILATAVRPPTVPRGSARLRLSLTLAHTTEDLQSAARLISQATQAEGVLRNNNSIVTHFARAADSYACQPGVQERVAGNVAAKLPEHQNGCDMNILEAGCGTGYLTKHLCRLFPASRIVAVDIADSMLTEAQKQFNGHHDNLEFRQADIGRTPLSQTFSLIVSSSSLHWVAPLSSAFHNLKRCLQPDGRIVFAMMVEGTLQELQSLRREVAPGKAPHQTLPTLSEVFQTMRATGISVSSWGTESLTITYPSPAAFLQTIQRQGVTGGFTTTSENLLTRGELRTLMHKYHLRHSLADGRVTATYSILYAEGYPTEPCKDFS